MNIYLVKRGIFIYFFITLSVQNYFAEDKVCYADFSSQNIRTENLNISTYKTTYNYYYGESWVMYIPGESHFVIKFETPQNFEKAILRVTHLSSYSSLAKGEGYSPINVKINGLAFLKFYDVAENHNGSHAFETDEWNITRYLKTGENIIIWELSYNAQTNYWIKDLKIKIESKEFDESAYNINVKTISDFIISSIYIQENKKEILEKSLEFMAKKTIGKLISEGVKYLVGLKSKIAGAIASHAVGFFLSFINEIPTVGIPTEIDYGFIYEGGFSQNLKITPGTSIYLTVFLQPGDEIMDTIYIQVVNENGKVEFSKAIYYEQLRDIWSFDNKILIISREPIVIKSPGKYKFGNARLRVE